MMCVCVCVCAILTGAGHRERHTGAASKESRLHLRFLVQRDEFSFPSFSSAYYIGLLLLLLHQYRTVLAGYS